MKKFAILALGAAFLAANGAMAGEMTASGKPVARNAVSVEAEQVFRNSFRADNPKYWMQRLEQDEAMKLCSQYKDNPPAKPSSPSERLTAFVTATITTSVRGTAIQAGSNASSKNGIEDSRTPTTLMAITAAAT